MSNSQPDLNARIWTCWDPNFCDILCVKKSNQFMFCKITVLDGDFSFFAIFVYAENKHVLRMPLFSDICTIAKSHSSFPVVCLGDFNAVRFAHEKIGGNSCWDNSKESLNVTILESDMDDLSYQGCQFTWANKRGEGDFITSKLDRVLVNEKWLESYTNSFAKFLPSGISDHSPTLVTLDPNLPSSKKPFKFFDFWADHEDFLPKVEEVWRKYIKGSPMFRVCQKLRMLKPILKGLNKREFSDISIRVVHAKTTLENSQIKLDRDPLNMDLQEKERTAYARFVALSKIEESLARQKSGVQWLSLGDRNSQFFFRNIKGNINRGRINSVVLDNGVRISKSEDVNNTFVNYFTNLLGKPFTDDYQGFERIEGLVTKKVNVDQYNSLAREVTDKEIQEAFWALKANKAPGPDGYSAGFYKKSWGVVGGEVVGAIKSFFNSGELLQELNSTTIALIPKVPNAERVGEYRPISCCNTLYKCISKIIAERIKLVLPELIDPVQSAFVQGRRISDNIFLSQEIVRGYHKSSPTPKCTMKVDIMKAYDNVRWDFILDSLKAMGFPPNFIHWVRACVTSPSFSICINGSLKGYFKGARGLRQGDPLSPYLFVIGMEILAKILAEKSTHPDFKFHWKCDKTKIVNLCFADDLMIFCKGDLFTIRAIKEGLDEFQCLSGLSPSPSKSQIFFSGCERTLREEIIQIVNFKEGFLPVRYLGVPLISTKLKSSDCAQLVERITKRIKSWTNKCLTYAGRAQLIQSVLFSLQVYWSSLFILPKKIIKAIEALFRSFLWSGCDLRAHGAKVSWDYMCHPKNEGGLGFKSLEIWNKVAIAKHIWFLFSGGEQSMWCQWVKSYILKGISFWRVKMPSDPSWVWRKILSLRPIIYPLIKCSVGNGASISLWFDNWHPIGSLWAKFGDRIIYDSALGLDAKVKDIVDNDCWKWPVISSWEIKELIESTPPLSILSLVLILLAGSHLWMVSFLLAQPGTF